MYHVLKRAVMRLPLFHKKAEHAAFERVMREGYARRPTGILARCLMRDHWHFVIWPREDGEVAAFVRWLSHTQVMRWHVAHGTVGWGSLYQGRFRSFPVQRGEHSLTLCRYVERNALTAGAVEWAKDWRWGSLWARRQGDDRLKALLGEWPVDRPVNWLVRVNPALQPIPGGSRALADKPPVAHKATPMGLALICKRPGADENMHRTGKLALTRATHPRRPRPTN